MFSDWLASPRLALMGGSFNPPHTGHLRMAFETWESLRPKNVVFIPAATPPHKQCAGLLPFAARLAMLRAAVRGIPCFTVSAVEGKRQGPSYTVDTLNSLTRKNPHIRLSFILGAPDFAQLATWSRWQNLPKLADIVVLPREEAGAEVVAETVRALWPAARPENAPLAGGASYILPEGGRVVFLPGPRLDISSSDLRRRWLAGLSCTGLMPAAVEKYLLRHRAEVAAAWRLDADATQ